jgi:hypothetical protein
VYLYFLVCFFKFHNHQNINCICKKSWEWRCVLLQVENVVMEGGKSNSMYKHDICMRLADCHNLICPKTIKSLFILHIIIEDHMFVEQQLFIFFFIVTSTTWPSCNIKCNRKSTCRFCIIVCLEFLIILVDVLHPSNDQLGSSRFIFWGALDLSIYLSRLVCFMKQGLSSSKVMVLSQ